MSELKINEFSKKYNISKITSTKIFKCLGELAESILKENPYTLKRFGGFAFKRCDEIARKIGFDMNSPIRVRACVDLAIEEIANGSTIIKTFEVMSRVSKICDIQSMDYIKKCIEKQEGDEIDYIFLNSELKPTDNNSINLWMTKSIYYNIEKYIFNMCLRASRTSVIEVNDKHIDDVERDLPFTLSKGQKEGLISFCKNNLNILTGLGGTGKSLVTKCLLDILDKTKQTYTLMTPTGKSAKVLEQSTGRPVQTIHSRCLSGGDINSDWLIIDECGMCSIEHFKLIRKVLTNFHIKILFIGDINQLQPISPAQPFRDLINLIKIGKLKGNIIELSEIMRASSELFIPHLCKQFTKFLPYDSRLELKKKGELKGVEFIKKTTDINTHILDILNENNLSFENTSILLPQNKGDYGCVKINMFLQEHFNGQNEILFSDKFKIYRKNDELMHIKNNYSMNIMNGERIKLLDKQGYRYIAQKVDTLEEVIYDEETLQNETILSYCNTIHKCQGMTQDNIIIVCISSHIYMLTKQLVYTGMSRASKKLFIIYDDGILRKAYNKDVVDERKTFLGEIAKIKNK